MPSKKPEPCKVCYKQTDKECSHVDCPNRKRVTAQIADGSGSYGSRNVLGHGYSGNFRKVPTKQGSDS